ncbi:ABC transporter ATP-binding protein [Methylobacterium nonmethylotrophicum]|uniref:ABC transporter ATP-binding protein n=1 Tax=Methylobacterium nonmethylotrophicum TaxID=1141884 RepID=A0A4Z0NHQ1_9HYPH|nr:ABC transporter ATP-binding protein [Methylobacterium nonmethylotrophicum]TGD95116.1 ABC transporter ATP-binding protein [Methylobacterium nonmethylotrophicum]
MTVAAVPSHLSLSALSCRYGAFTAVDALDLDVKGGEFISLLGPSGCGKTTTLRMIAGFVRPTSGTIRLDGRVISSSEAVLPPERRGMSMIFQSYAIWPNMTVAENVAFGLKLRRLNREEVARKVAAILDTVRLGALADRYPAELSGGQQQRVALARAIVIEPRVLLLDEPLSNLDANLREEMRHEIRRLHDAFGFTTVYVTHDQGEAMVTSDRIAVMNQGRIEQIDAPYTLYTRPRSRFVAGFIGRTNLLEGRRTGDRIAFEGFDLPADLLEPGAGGASAPVTYAVRPQSLTLSRAAPDAAAPTGIEVSLAERAFLGETWTYVVSLPRGARLSISAAPSEIFEVGDRLWLTLDPRHMVPLSG